MCGIAGIIDFEGRPVDPGSVVRMAQVQKHRGPDGEGVVFLREGARARRFDRLEATEIGSVRDATGALAHRRLSIIDLSEDAAQPMSTADGRHWLTYNGEIYNYVELRGELEGLGRRFRSRSDTEVLLHAYGEWGTDCVDRLNGMFAFALWDASARRLFCARDRLGIKPFHYRNCEGRLLFASEIKGILAAMSGRPTPNLAAMNDYLCLSYVLSDETMFEGVRRLAPGTCLIADAAGVRTRTYWDPSFDPSGPTEEGALCEELSSLLDDALRLQVRSDVPLGAHLSGGLDSSLVCCLAARHVPTLQTFSARFDEGPAFDESPWARLVARRVSADHHELVPRAEDLRDVLPRLIRHLDQPVEGPAVYGKYNVAAAVGQQVKVVLTGHGGDELFGGYDWYVKNLFTSACFGAPAVLGAHPRAGFLWNALIRSEYPRRLAASLWRNRFDSDLGRIFFRNWSRVSPARLTRVLRPEARLNGAGTEARFHAAFASLSELRGGDRMFKFDMRHYLEALLASEDRLSMAFSVESRLPLLDHRIAELAGRIGFEGKTRPETSKPLLRAVARHIVPEEIYRRKDKRGFPTPVDRWFADPRLSPFDSLVFEDNRFADRYFDLKHVKRLLGQRVRMGSGWSETLWRVLSLSVWGEAFDL